MCAYFFKQEFKYYILFIPLQVISHCIYSQKKLAKFMTWRLYGPLDRNLMKNYIRRAMLLIFLKTTVLI